MKVNIEDSGTTTLDTLVYGDVFIYTDSIRYNSNPRMKVSNVPSCVRAEDSNKTFIVDLIEGVVKWVDGDLSLIKVKKYPHTVLTLK